MKMTIKNVLVIGFASLALVGCATKSSDHNANVSMDQSGKWEYHTEIMLPAQAGQTTTRLNELNAQGWQLVSITPIGQNGVNGAETYSFKRSKQ